MKQSGIGLLLTLLAIAIFSFFGPLEKTLGSDIRIVYLHGVWVWTALIAFGAAGLAGIIAWLLRRETFHQWSLAFGRTGLFFWISYLPLSLWAMQTSWNGLFLAEPRWRLAVGFALGGVMLQTGLTLVRKADIASLSNLAFAVILFATLLATPNVMHPPSPILDSDALRIRVFFASLLALTLAAAVQLAIIFLLFQTQGLNIQTRRSAPP